MVEELVQSGIPEELIVLIMSMLPIVELRGALPIAINSLYLLGWLGAVIAGVGLASLAVYGLWRI